MPTSIRRGGVGLSRLEQDRFPASYHSPLPLIGTWSMEAIGQDLGMATNNFVDTTWVGANTAYAYPFELSDYFLVRKVWWANGSDATGPHIDVGVYAEAGGLLVSAGDITATGASLIQEADVTDTLLQPGRYWCACVSSTTTGGVLAVTIPAALLRAIGCAQMGTAFPLPDPFVPAAVSSAFMPLFGIANRTQVA